MNGAGMDSRCPGATQKAVVKSLKTMFRYLYPITLLTLLLLALLVSGAIALGSTQSPPSALAGFSPCEGNEWCWFGISPDRTEVAQAEQILFRHGYTLESISTHRYLAPPESNLCDVQTYTRFGEMYLFALVLECHGVRVGDLTSIFGTPTGFAITSSPNSGTGFNPPPALVFGEALIVTKPQWVSLYGDITEIWLTRTSSTAMTVREWRSFNEYSLCQLQPFTYGC